MIVDSVPRRGRPTPDRSDGRPPIVTAPRPCSGGCRCGGGDAGVAAIQTRPRLAVAPDLVLRQLGPAPLTADGDWIIEELRALYEAITSGTAALALGDESE